MDPFGDATLNGYRCSSGRSVVILHDRGEFALVEVASDVGEGEPAHLDETETLGHSMT
jgi:hypothetical protein